MALPDRFADWQEFHPTSDRDDGAVDSRARLRLAWLVFVLLVITVLARVAALEFSYGEAYRSEADRPLERQVREPAMRGRILAADGTVLALDEPRLSLAVNYRFIEQPADPRWLRKLARARLPRSAWREPGRLEREEQAVLAERNQLHQRLAALCGIEPEEFQHRAARVQARVRRISDGVNQRRRQHDEERQAEQQARSAAAATWWQWAEEILFPADEESLSGPITVAEELDDHVIFEPLPLEAVAEVEGRPDLYPGVRVVEQSRRRYPLGSLAAHALGHLGALREEDVAALGGSNAAYDRTDRVGRLGIERQYEPLLRAKAGMAIERRDRSGQLLQRTRQRDGVPGRDVILSLDLELQRTAESLLDSALGLRGRAAADGADGAGAAIVVLDVRSGSVLAAASAPRFDPNVMTLGRAAEINQLLADPRKPLFDRTIKMAIPPGSVFKTLSAVALLESGAVRPEELFFCQGFWRDPERLRCMLFRRRGVGHGEVSLADALAVSCNVYFFHFAADMGPAPLIDWSRRFGFGRPTGIDLTGEAAGFVPSPTDPGRSKSAKWNVGDTQALAIGQSTLEVTPLQIARLMAAVASDGKLVTPRIVKRLGLSESGSEDGASEDDRRPTPAGMVEGLQSSTLAAVRAGLERVVADPDGTAHRTVFLDSVSIAGKTGTAETGAGQGDHAWFAGYAPAGHPRVAFVVVLEHAGGGSDMAGPIARRLVSKLEKLGYFGRNSATALLPARE